MHYINEGIINKILVIDRCHFCRSGLEKWLNHPDDILIKLTVITTHDLLLAKESILQWQPAVVVADLYSFRGEQQPLLTLCSVLNDCHHTTRTILLQSRHSATLNDECILQAAWRSVDKSIPLDALRQLIQEALTFDPLLPNAPLPPYEPPLPYERSYPE